MRTATTHSELTASFTPTRSHLLQRKCACGNSAGLTGSCPACDQKKLQRQATQSDAVSEVPPIVHEVLRSPSQPLDSDTRQLMELRFDRDFSQVRVHTDTKAAQSAQAVNAMAFTIGRNIVFNSGRYAPSTQSGQRLLAHELTHVVQQPDANASGIARQAIAISKPSDAAEQEADQIADAVVSGQRADFNKISPAGTTLQRACGQAAIGPTPPTCTLASRIPKGERFLFKIGCDEFAPGEQARLEAFTDTIASSQQISVLGTASSDGNRDVVNRAFNESLSCHRANAAAAVLHAKGRGANIRSVEATGAIGAAGDHTLRAVAIDLNPAPTPTPPIPKSPPAPEPPSHPDACKPYSNLTEAKAKWLFLSTSIPAATAGVTRCAEVSAVWDTYFAKTSKPFAFSDPSSCVVKGAKTDSEASAGAERAAKALLKDINNYLPVTLQGVKPSPILLPGYPIDTLRLLLAEAIGPHGPHYLHLSLVYNDPSNAAANLAGAVGTMGEGSDIFGDDDREISGKVVIDVTAINPLTGGMSGEVRWLPHIHVKDTVDFCPGNLGNWWQESVTVPMSRLEAMGWTRDVPITIDYDLDLQTSKFTNVIPKSKTPKE